MLTARMTNVVSQNAPNSFHFSAPSGSPGLCGGSGALAFDLLAFGLLGGDVLALDSLLLGSLLLGSLKLG